MKMGVSLPENAVLELTYRCNHRCVFCSCPWENDRAPVKFEKHPEFSVEQWKAALEVLRKTQVRRVTISGGEPLLKEGLAELLLFIREKTNFNRGEKIVLISNAAAMNEDFLALFQRIDVHLALSLPGLTTFTWHTGAEGNTPDNVLRWLERAKKVSISTSANITVTRKNYHELYETIANALISGADTVLLNRFLPGGRGLANSAELSLSKKQIAGMLDTAEEVLELSNRIGSVGTEIPLCVIPSRKGENKRLRVGSLCSAAKDFFVVDPSGFLRVCNHSPVRVGYIFDTDIIRDKEYWRLFTERAYIPGECADCADVARCDCGCREAASICSGSVATLDPCLNAVDIGGSIN